MTGPLIHALLFLPAVIAADPASWPQFRGPGGSGIAEGPAPVAFALQQKPIWSAELPSGHSSPSIRGSHLVLTAFDAKSQKLEVIDFDRSNGRERWRQTVPASEIEAVHPMGSAAAATVAIDEERVYAYFGSCGLFAFDLDGKPAWRIPMSTVKVGYGSASSPVLAGDSVILVREDIQDPYIIAVDRKTGRELWKTKLRTGRFQSHATPLIWKNQILLHEEGAIRSYRLSDGVLQWWVAMDTQATGTAVIDGDTLYVGAWFGEASLRDPLPDWTAMLARYDKNGDGFLSKEEFPDDLALVRRIEAGSTPGAVVTFKGFFNQMLDLNHDGKVSRDEWESLARDVTARAGAHGTLAVRLGGTGDMTARNLLWSEDRAVPEVPAPLAYLGRVYTVTNGGIVTVLDAVSGKLVYRARLGAGGLYYSSPVAAGGRIYFGSGDGVITVIDAAGEQIKVVVHNDLGEGIFATPAIVEGRIYIRTTGHLYAFGN